MARVFLSFKSATFRCVPVFQVCSCVSCAFQVCSCVLCVFLCFKCVPVFAASGTWPAASRDIYNTTTPPCVEMRVAVCVELGASLLRSDLSSKFSLRFSAPHTNGFRVQGLGFVDHVASTATPHRDARQVD